MGQKSNERTITAGTYHTRGASFWASACRLFRTWVKPCLANVRTSIALSRPDRYNVLTGMDFDFDEENAEWMVAYKAVSARHLDQSGDPCRGVGAEDFYLTNW